MKKRILPLLLAASLILSACGQAEVEDDTEKIKRERDEEVPPPVDGDGTVKPEPLELKLGARPSIMGDEEVIYHDTSLVPAVEAYSVNADFSNVVYDEKFTSMWDENDENYYEYNSVIKSGLIKNNFYVDSGRGQNEFFDIYESNRYNYFPNFITVDSIMHTYHLYFGYLMRTTEREQLSVALKTLSEKMLKSAADQYDELKGTDWEEAALRNTEFFYIAAKLTDESTAAPVKDASFTKVTDEELERIQNASGIEICGLNGEYEDYSQYMPRGYYEGDEELQKYFRAMMWYGRIAFPTDDEEMVKSAVLMSLALNEDSADWEKIYAVTSFFAGASDDPGFVEMASILNGVYGSIPTSDELVNEKEGLASIMQALKEMDPPAVNSIPVMDGDDPVIKSFRFMGQRFTIDAAIMQRLVYSAVEETEDGDRRMLPDTLDVAAALGSDRAYEILENEGKTGYPRYDENLMLMKQHFNNDDPALWNASLYSGWLNTLRPMFVVKGEGYPSFMTGSKWIDKDLETFAGSFAELKHDTILYSKQVIAEMGGPEELDGIDDRGYVEPEPVVYGRLINLVKKTVAGLDDYGMLSDGCREDLERLDVMAQMLLSISEKELKNEDRDAQDYEFIKNYGGDLEHFWSEANSDLNDEMLGYSYQAPGQVVADIATDPNGAVLEVGTGTADTIYVVFPVDGELHIGSGSVYSFYQFVSDERLTDSRWREMLSGGYLDDNWEWVEVDGAPEKPAWTQNIRNDQ